AVEAASRSGPQYVPCSAVLRPDRLYRRGHPRAGLSPDGILAPGFVLSVGTCRSSSLLRHGFSTPPVRLGTRPLTLGDDHRLPLIDISINDMFHDNRYGVNGSSGEARCARGGLSRSRGDRRMPGRGLLRRRIRGRLRRAGPRPAWSRSRRAIRADARGRWRWLRLRDWGPWRSRPP